MSFCKSARLGFRLFTAAAMLLVGCKRTGSTAIPSTQSAGNPQQIAVIAKGTTSSYWKSCEGGARQAAREDGVDILWTGPDAETNHTQQASMVDNMASRGVAGIVLAPTNVDALVRPVESAVKRGIPVVLMDSGLNSATPSSSVATDNAAAGHQAASALVAAIGANKPFGGKILMLRFLEGSGSTTAREKGFTDGIAAAGLTLAGDAYTMGSGSASEAADTADALLRRFMKDNAVQVDGIFAANEPAAVGMLRKIEQFRAQGITVNAPYVGFDASAPLLAGVRDGTIAALISQDPRQIGYLAVKTLDQVLKGQKVAASIATPTVAITKANLDSPQVTAIVGQ